MQAQPSSSPPSSTVSESLVLFLSPKLNQQIQSGQLEEETTNYQTDSSSNEIELKLGIFQLK